MTKQLKSDYRYLRKRIAEIEKNLISPSMRSSLRLTDRQNDLTRSYRVLSHAELESYFENIATHLISNAENRWREFSVANYNLTSLLAHSEKMNGNETSSTKVFKAIDDYKRLIKANNGVKQDNIKKLFCPLGYSENDFDSAWLASLSSYGADRGIVAHTSKKTQSALDAGTEISTMSIIITGIEDFENVLLSRLDMRRR